MREEAEIMDELHGLDGYSPPLPFLSSSYWLALFSFSQVKTLTLYSIES
jgi:hypothetical protein